MDTARFGYTCIMDLSLAEHLIRLSLAALAGMAIGLEREWREKAAGFRTVTLVALGTSAFVLAAENLSPDATARAIAGVATGVGFLGAGAILRDRGQVLGLTTAAAVWMAAALGVSAGLGAYTLTVTGLVFALGVLLLLPLVNLSAVQQDARTYEVVYEGVGRDVAVRGPSLADAGLSFTMLSISVGGGEVKIVWQTYGRRERHDQAISLLSEEPGVARFTVT